MAKFRKQIVAAGVYDIPLPGGGSRVELLTPTRLQHWAETGNRMLRAGFRIPAPWCHDPNALPFKMGNDGTLPNSLQNVGFWESLEVSANEQGVPALFGLVDVPGDAQDPNSPAGKIGNTIQDTSVYVRPNFRDSAGRNWSDALMHIALVTHPVEHGQPNFQPVPKSGIETPAIPGSPVHIQAGELALSMSHCRYQIDAHGDWHLAMAAPGSGLAANGPGTAGGSPVNATGARSSKGLTDTLGDESGDRRISSFQELLIRLREVAKIALPEDTTEETLVERLGVALMQKAASEEDEEKPGSTIKPPEGAREQTAPVVMSFKPEQVQAIVTAQVVNPTTGQPFTADELVQIGEVQMSQKPATPPAAPVPPAGNSTPDEILALVMSHPKVQELQQTTAFLARRVNEQALATVQSRINGLIAKGLPKTYVDTHITPLLTGFQMSFNPDGSQRKHPVEVILDGLEPAINLVAPARTSGVSALLTPSQLNSALSMSNPPGTEEPLPEHLRPSQVTDEKAAEVANEFLKNTSF
jgi:hypothetical protein